MDQGKAHKPKPGTWSRLPELIRAHLQALPSIPLKTFIVLCLDARDSEEGRTVDVFAADIASEIGASVVKTREALRTLEAMRCIIRLRSGVGRSGKARFKIEFDNSTVRCCLAGENRTENVTPKARKREPKTAPKTAPGGALRYISSEIAEVPETPPPTPSEPSNPNGPGGGGGDRAEQVEDFCRREVGLDPDKARALAIPADATLELAKLQWTESHKRPEQHRAGHFAKRFGNAAVRRDLVVKLRALSQRAARAACQEDSDGQLPYWRNLAHTILPEISSQVGPIPNDRKGLEEYCRSSGCAVGPASAERSPSTNRTSLTMRSGRWPPRFRQTTNEANDTPGPPWRSRRARSLRPEPKP